ncbi:MAG: M23 family metallopeptidase [Alphaproteobacteria bacterium]|nr:M23 family metallopeptidase [Alphaproteobacteria bacterium]
MLEYIREFPLYFKRVFPERQIFYRVRGEIEFVTFKAFHQIALFFILVGVVGWVAFSSMHYMAFDWMLENQRQDAKRAWDAYLQTDSERERVVAQREDLKERLRNLELTLAVLQVSQEKVMARVTERTEGRIDQVARIIEMTGIEVSRFLKSGASRRAAAAMLTGQGGPFVGAGSDEELVGDQDPLRVKVAALDNRLGQWDRLESVLESMPLAPPVDHYRLTSRFGSRKDPVNGRWARHYGIDLANHLNTPVLSPAPGTVVFAGRNGRYGRYLEIDHGNGFRTRYGHLRKMLVKKGEKVQFRQEIAKLGSSGRSTGPHLHYEVLVNGKPIDPLKFIAAGRYFFKLSLAEAD